MRRIEMMMNVAPLFRRATRLIDSTVDDQKIVCHSLIQESDYKRLIHSIIQESEAIGCCSLIQESN